jgi:hypothetical protein
MVLSRYAAECVDAAVSQACREHGLDLTHMASIYAYLDEDEDAWPRCCGSACDPCVATLGAVTRRALTLLERDEVSTGAAGRSP